MEIKESVLKQVAALVGTDTETLTTYFKSGEGFTFPELHTTEQLNTFGATKDKEGYERAKNVSKEIHTKDLKKKYPDIKYDGKDPFEMLNRITKYELELAKIEPTEQIETLKKEKEIFANQLEERDLSIVDIKKEYENKLYSVEVNNNLLSMFPKESTLPNDKLLILFNSEYKIDKEDGEQIIFKGGKKLQDQYGKPLELKDVVSGWVDENKFITHKGFGEDDKGGTNGDKKFIDANEHYEFCIKNKIEPMSDEGLALLSKE